MKGFWNFLQTKINLLKEIIVLGSSDIVGLAITSFFWLYMSTIMEVDQYGQLHFFISIAGIASLISLVGTNNVIVVYTAKNIKIQSTLSFLSIITGVIAFFIIGIFYRIDIGFLLLGFVIHELATGYLLGKKLFINFSKYFLLQKSLSVGLGFGFFQLFGLEGILYGFALSYVHLFFIIYKIFKESKINIPSLKTHSGFIINNYVMSNVVSLRTHLDKIIIAPLLGFSTLGNYSLALQIFGILTIFESILFKYILPHDASGNPNIKLKKYTLILAVCIALLGIFILPIIIPSIFPKFTDTADMIRIISLAVISTTFVKIYISKFLGMEKSRFVLYGRLISLFVTVSGILLLAPIFGVFGIALVFVISSTAHAFTLIYFDRKYFHS